ncbi:MAG: T9SS type A sorting domain-containing protein [Taibaiella sp.]|nr:T9SS type A sorting domain-containing protein [Taibaiella sp.]
MKKLSLIFACFFLAGNSFSQPVDNGGMETWRSSTAICLSPFSITPISAPTVWSGSDSLALALGPTVVGTGGAGFNRQLFKETSFVHSGTACAKLMTALEGDLGYFPVFLSNGALSVDPSSPDLEEAFTFNGGMAVTVMPTNVSAWVAYFPGKDTVTDTIGFDEGLLTVQAVAKVGALDSIVGAGLVTISPSDVFTEVTANIVYTTSDYPVHSLRIIFASSADLTAALDSSTLYVDDVSMTSIPNPPPTNVSSYTSDDAIRVYPNPAKSLFNVSGTNIYGFHCTLLSVTGQVVSNTLLTGTDKIDVSSLATGNYLYTITDKNGYTVKQGNIILN